MEYSSNDIAAATSLQAFTYMYVSLTTFWTYDYVCSLRQEWIFLLRSRWTKVKGLYIVTRHLPFLPLTMNLYLSFTPNKNLGECRTLENICSGLSMLSIICSECFFILRIYALWDNNRIVLAVMLSAFLAFVVAGISIAFDNTVSASYATSPIPGITGCYQSSDSVQLFIPFLLSSVLELGLMILTLIRAIQNWRGTNSHLYVVVLKHNILYYACGLCESAHAHANPFSVLIYMIILVPKVFSVANIFTSLFLNYAYHAMLHDFQFIILAILATRMHRHLWHEISPDALMRIPMSDMLTADRIMTGGGGHSWVRDALNLWGCIFCRGREISYARACHKHLPKYQDDRKMSMGRDELDKECIISVSGRDSVQCHSHRSSCPDSSVRNTKIVLSCWSLRMSTISSSLIVCKLPGNLFAPNDLEELVVDNSWPTKAANRPQIGCEDKGDQVQAPSSKSKGVKAKKAKTSQG
ncbi:uncharacterized protein EDB91DRAFT_1336797 [Suillus paluster]|uniref:uncharacterized protein n=1 Tax=Suillus paluster TaxID=48578 RepID=UPI001B867F91|nr:uncharacterized protein EDB91DRAFT_1336797 [Suillus paluster]KAG1739468.1 hypothetical protein EDB91DRAFT_1336797 [Suillus paluster]